MMGMKKQRGILYMCGISGMDRLEWGGDRIPGGRGASDDPDTHLQGAGRGGILRRGRSAVLGHRRLIVVDPAGGAQPMDIAWQGRTGLPGIQWGIVQYRGHTGRSPRRRTCVHRVLGYGSAAPGLPDLGRGLCQAVQWDLCVCHMGCAPDRSFSVPGTGWGLSPSFMGRSPADGYSAVN